MKRGPVLTAEFGFQTQRKLMCLRMKYGLCHLTFNKIAGPRGTGSFVISRKVTIQCNIQRNNHAEPDKAKEYEASATGEARGQRVISGASGKWTSITRQTASAFLHWRIAATGKASRRGHQGGSHFSRWEQHLPQQSSSAISHVGHSGISATFR